MDESTAAALLNEAQDARMAMRRGEDASAIERFERLYADLRAAMHWQFDQGRAPEADRFASELISFWMATKRLDDGRAWFEHALVGDAATDPSRARAVYDHGYLVFWSGQYDLAQQRFAQAHELAKRSGDRNLVALTLAGSARVALDSDPGTAVRLLEEALAATADLPDSEGRSSADHVLGVALQMTGDLEGAREVMRARLERARKSGHEYAVAIESANLSMVERQLGNVDAAEELSLDALRISSRSRNEIMVPWVINGLAAVTAARGRLERAAVLLGVAEALLGRAGGQWPPDEREQYEWTLAIVSASLSSEPLERARAAGHAMSLAEGTAFALATPGDDRA